MNELHRLSRLESQLALRKILLAIALTTVGQQDQKTWMVETGIGLYGSSLAALSSQLESRDGKVGENSFATSKLLSLYEV
jgi:hypothetical protein